MLIVDKEVYVTRIDITILLKHILKELHISEAKLDGALNTIFINGYRDKYEKDAIKQRLVLKVENGTANRPYKRTRVITLYKAKNLAAILVNRFSNQRFKCSYSDSKSSLTIEERKGILYNLAGNLSIRKVLDKLLPIDEIAEERIEEDRHI